MYTLLVLAASVALACCVTEPPPSNSTSEPSNTTPEPSNTTPELHQTHEPHPTHPTHAPHPTHPPHLEHTFSDKNAVFMQDLPNMVIILKTDSGCYVAHLNHEDVKHIENLEHLLKIETEILHQVTHSHHFTMAHDPDHYSEAVKTACPKLYAYHHEH